MKNVNKREIEEVLLENKHNWDEMTTNVLIDYFYELSITIGSFVNVNNLLINFVKGDNLKNGIVYVEENLINNKYDAVYNYKDLCVRVAKSKRNNDYIKYIIFHELTHALSKNSKGIGFYSCTGLNEGTTELITMLRNNKIGYKFSNNGIYNIVTSLCYLLGYILGYSNMFDSYFYDEGKLKKLIEDKNMDYKEIATCLNYFLDQDEQFIDLKFDEDFISFTRMIIYNFFDSFGEILNLDDFENKMKFISLYINSPFSINIADEYSTYIEIIMNKNNLLELNYNEEEIDNILKKYELYDIEKFAKYKKINEEEFKEENN